MIFFILWNTFCFFLCFLDKRAAQKKKYRYSENLLLFFSIFGGCFGFALGMICFSHKTKKKKFKIVYVCCLIYLLFYILKLGGML